jgi:peptidoglycan/LPS O-acetylase OafA/YrhL
MTAQLQLRRLDRRYYGLQYLRALAALMVLLVHALRPGDVRSRLSAPAFICSLIQASS